MLSDRAQFTEKIKHNELSFVNIFLLFHLMTIVKCAAAVPDKRCLYSLANLQFSLLSRFNFHFLIQGSL